MQCLVGVDGGGSKTCAVVTDTSGRPLGSGRAGCGNHQVVGIEVALANIRTAVEAALMKAHLDPDNVAFVQYGLAGADRDKDYSILRPALATLPFANWDVVCDTMVGLRAGSPDNVGVVLVCGAGTNAAGRNRLGKTVQVGGFGTFYGDAAGGNHMAEQTFRAAVRSWEGREESTLLEGLVARHLGFADMGALFHHFLDHDICQVPLDLTLVLHRAAEEGDAVAIRLLQDTGRELGLAARAVIQKLGGFPGEAIRIVLVGSVLSRGRSPHLLAALRETIAQQVPSANLVLPTMEPVYGAVMLAMDKLHIPITESMMHEFSREWVETA